MKKENVSTKQCFKRSFGCLSLLFALSFHALSTCCAEIHKIEKKGNGDNTSFLFSYRRQSGILPRYFDYNKANCDSMDAFIRARRKDIREGKSHLALTAYIPGADISNPEKINDASIQASVVRAYIKVWHLISHKQFTFVFDTTQSFGNKVRVDYHPYPIPKNSNSTIYYTLEHTHKAVVASVMRYDPLPFANPVPDDKNNLAYNETGNFYENASYKTGATGGRNISGESGGIGRQGPTNEKTSISGDMVTPADKIKIQENNNKSQSKKESADNSLSDIVSSSVQAAEHSRKNEKNEPWVAYCEKKVLLHPVVALKTNVLYWAGITPEFERNDPLPNGELEWFFKKHWSLNFDAAYIYQRRNNADNEIYATSGYGLEGRYWLNRRGQYSGLYGGIYGITGDFDIKLNRISSSGDTGDFNDAGLSLGVYLPITSRIGLEAGARYGIHMITGSTYDLEEPKHSYKKTPYTKNEFKLSTIRFLVSYRLGKANTVKK
jgi:hypothetical protein